MFKNPFGTLKLIEISFSSTYDEEFREFFLDSVKVSVE